jgi:hypothetical protein
MSVIIVAMIATLILLVRQKSSTPIQIADFEGTIVDRWADYAESDQGSRPRMALVVESSVGKRFTVGVEPGLYESARVGMRIKRKLGQIVLIEGNNNSRW